LNLPPIMHLNHNVTWSRTPIKHPLKKYYINTTSWPNEVASLIHQSKAKWNISSYTLEAFFGFTRLQAFLSKFFSFFFLFLKSILISFQDPPLLPPLSISCFEYPKKRLRSVDTFLFLFFPLYFFLRFTKIPPSLPRFTSPSPSSFFFLWKKKTKQKKKLGVMRGKKSHNDHSQTKKPKTILPTKESTFKHTNDRKSIIEWICIHSTLPNNLTSLLFFFLNYV